MVTAFALTRLRSLFAAVMLTGIYSLLTAGVFMVLDAVDVAFTEAAVGAGITTVLMLGTLSLIGYKTDSDQNTNKKHVAHPAWLPLVVVLLTGSALIYTTLDMPHFGRADAPVHQHVAPRYIQDSAQEVGPPNMVTSVLASYRGYDTLGEVAVIFTAGIAVLLLLGIREKGNSEKDKQ